MYELRFAELVKLLKILDPKTDDTIFGRLPEQYFAVEEEQNLKIAKWIAENEGVVSKNKLNINHIYKALKAILNFGNTGNKSIGEVIEQMKLPEREVK